ALSSRRKTHHDEACQRRGLEKSSTRRLDPVQQIESSPSGQVTEDAGNRIARRRLVVAKLPDGYQGRQRIAHHWQTQSMEPALGESGQLEGELHDASPAVRTFAKPARQGEHGEDRDRECAVLPVTAGNGGGKVARIQAACAAADPGRCARFY